MKTELNDKSLDEVSGGIPREVSGSFVLRAPEAEPEKKKTTLIDRLLALLGIGI